MKRCGANLTWQKCGKKRDPINSKKKVNSLSVLPYRFPFSILSILSLLAIVSGCVIIQGDEECYVEKSALSRNDTQISVIEIRVPGPDVFSGTAGRSDNIELEPLEVYHATNDSSQFKNLGKTGRYGMKIKIPSGKNSIKLAWMDEEKTLDLEVPADLTRMINISYSYNFVEGYSFDTEVSRPVLRGFLDRICPNE